MAAQSGESLKRSRLPLADDGTRVIRSPKERDQFASWLRPGAGAMQLK